MRNNELLKICGLLLTLIHFVMEYTNGDVLFVHSGIGEYSVLQYGALFLS